MAKVESRTKRWADACADARSAYDELKDAASRVEMALDALREIKLEYEEWQGNLPGNLQSPVALKLEEVCDLDLDLELELSDLDRAISAAEDVELPQGFGRDRSST